MSDQPLDELLRQCQRGDEKALESIVRDYQDRIYRLAYRVVRDESLAEEATVSTLYKVWSKSSQWRESVAAESWLFRIAVRTVLDVQRARMRWWRRARLESNSNGFVSLQAADARPAPDDEVIARDERRRQLERMEDAIGRLDVEARMLVHLYYYEERGLAEIASILNVSANALKGRLWRARQRLRTILGELGETDE